MHVIEASDGEQRYGVAVFFERGAPVEICYGDGELDMQFCEEWTEAPGILRTTEVARLFSDEDLAELGVRLVALNDTGNRIGDGVQDDFAEWEREVITERTRAGRFDRARSGRLLIGYRPLYVYRLTDDGRYEVHPVEMEGVRLVLGLAAEGEPLRAIRRALHAAGFPSPTGKERWRPYTVKRVVLQEAYRPHYAPDDE